MLEIALFQALTSLDPMVTFAEAEWQFRPSGCIRWLRSTAADLTPRARSELEALLDKAQVHARIGRDRASLHAPRDAQVPSDLRIGPSAKEGWDWVAGVHEGQVQQLAQR
jgi:hypothetical protein